MTEDHPPVTAEGTSCWFEVLLVGIVLAFAGAFIIAALSASI